MSHLVAITGATGHIGGAIAESLLKSGHRVCAIARDKDKLDALAAKGAETRPGDLTDTAFLTDAFRDADAVFAMIPPNPAAPDLRADQRKFAESICTALGSAGRTRVVALSSVGGGLKSGTGPIAGLHEFEELLKTVQDTPVVILRPTYFMENFLYSIPLIKSAGINGGSIRGDISMPMIATKDIASVAADELAEPKFDGYTVHELIGPRDYTFREATSIIGTAIGKPDLPYVEFASEDYRKGLLDAGFSESVADAYLEMETAIDGGRIQATMSRDNATTTPTTLEEFAREVFAPVYKGAAAEARG
jgi:uncharacterized protein YbjT (DUF2867 family)